jgi:hypothetical protein
MARGSITSVLRGASKLSQLEDTLEAINVKLSCAGLTALNSNTQLPDVYPTGSLRGRMAHRCDGVECPVEISKTCCPKIGLVKLDSIESR